MRPKSAPQLADALDGLVPALADEISGSEVLPECYPMRIVAKEDDLLGPKALGGDHAAQADRAVALLRCSCPDAFAATAA